MAKKPLYITTTLPYVNADPHIGFATEIVQADALARSARLSGRDVFFNTGTDEHGQKVYEGAQKEGKSEQEYVDHYAQSVKDLQKSLNLSCDNFIRTTDKKHKEAAQELWRRCEAKGDIEKRVYKGLYCVGCEKYLTEKDLEDGKCPLHPNKVPQIVEEENYFFKLSKYQKQLEEYLSQEGVIIPDYRREEALEFVKNGLEDFSISREKEKMPWGVAVPGDESQVMYVWFDALTNYISTLGWPEDTDGLFTKFWEEGETLQMAGKDQVRFQSVMWQGMLLSAGIKATDRVFYHGFINSGGQRMSKSTGNVIGPNELIERYGTDATRYLLLRHVHPTDDTDITWEKLDEWYEAGLVNGLGNLVARTLNLSEQYINPIPQKHFEEVSIREGFDELVTSFSFNEGLNTLWQAVGKADEHLTETEPFKKIKSENEKEREEARTDIATAVMILLEVGTHLQAVMPETSEKIINAIKENKKPENLFPRLEK